VRAPVGDARTQRDCVRSATEAFRLEHFDILRTRRHAGSHNAGRFHLAIGGIEVRTNQALGRDVALEALRRYDAGIGLAG
jgi:hypothetical protein